MARVQRSPCGTRRLSSSSDSLIHWPQAITYEKHRFAYNPGSVDMASEEQLNAFIARHRELLKREREAEIERTSLLLSNCAPKLLEQKGLALCGLGTTSVGIGLGGKTYASFHACLNYPRLIVLYSVSWSSSDRRHITAPRYFLRTR